MTPTAHVDTFARDRLPPPEAQPEFLFDLPELQFPPRLNCATELLDRHVAEGRGERMCVRAPDGTAWTYAELQRRADRIAHVLVEDMGLVAGNRVLLRAANKPMLVACWFAVMKAGGGGKMINTGSMMSLFGAPYATPYCASKGGLVQMTRALATAWAKDNIQVIAILPGWIDTDLTRNARRQVEGLHAKVEARTPAGRWGVPPDLSGIAVFLASPASDFVTGTAIPVDGGFSISM